MRAVVKTRKETFFPLLLMILGMIMAFELTIGLGTYFWTGTYWFGPRHDPIVLIGVSAFLLFVFMFLVAFAFISYGYYKMQQAKRKLADGTPYFEKENGEPIERDSEKPE